MAASQVKAFARSAQTCRFSSKAPLYSSPRGPQSRTPVTTEVRSHRWVQAQGMPAIGTPQADASIMAEPEGIGQTRKHEHVGGAEHGCQLIAKAITDEQRLGMTSTRATRPGPAHCRITNLVPGTSRRAETHRYSSQRPPARHAMMGRGSPASSAGSGPVRGRNNLEIHASLPLVQVLQSVWRTAASAGCCC